MKVSQRFHNDTYAPGIATYGINGKTGEQGLPGTSMFFTDYSLPGDLSQFAQKITSRKLPIKTEETILQRRFVNGDLFVIPDGNIYKLIDIDKLSIDSNNGGSIDTASNYIVHVGKFSETAEPFVDSAVNALCSKTLTIRDDGKTTARKTSLLNIVKSDNKDDITFINMQALFDNAANANFKIKYDKGYNAFVLESQYPILLKSNVFTNTSTAAKQISGYSPVVTSNNTITDFVGACREYNYDIDASIFSYSKKDSSALYYGCVYKVALLDKSKAIVGDQDQTLERYYSDRNLMVHFQNGSFQDFQNYRKHESIYYFRQNYDDVKLNDTITRVKYTELPQINVSLVYNIECYLTPNNKAISGLIEKTN